MFQLAGGSVQGTDHRRTGRNNQDAFYFTQDEDLLIALVADGCGSSTQSEVGAQLGLSLLSSAIRRQMAVRCSEERPDFDRIIESARQDVLAQLRTLSLGLDSNLSSIVSQHFLFTVVGLVAVNDYAWAFSCGDGLFVINGEITLIGPFDQNRPPYLGYGLLEDFNSMSETSTFTVHRKIVRQDLYSFAIGTDGVTELLRLETSLIPGKSEAVGRLNQFWTSDRFLINPEAINRRLRLINQEAYVFDPQTRQLLRHDRGLLPDDTTIVVGRLRE